MEEDRDDPIIEDSDDPLYYIDLDDPLYDVTGDPIIEEIRAIREAHAARFNYDTKAIIEDLIKKQEESDYEFLEIAPRKRCDTDSLTKDEDRN